MVGSYTAFELEAERRREVLEASMRDARNDRRSPDEASHDQVDGPTQSRGLGNLVADLVNRRTQRA